MTLAQQVLQQLINGIALGSVYALIARYTMVYGIIRLINFAHGEVYDWCFCRLLYYHII